MSQAQQLYHLQEIDSSIREKKTRLTEVLQAQKETPELIAARTRSSKADAELQTWQSQRRDLNLELESLNSKAKRSEQRLYSGNVKNPKELSDLQSEIASLGRRRAALEDEILEAMIMIEEAETEKTAADESLNKVSAKWERAQSNYKQEQNEVALALHQFMNQRKEQLKMISAEALSEYDSLSRSKNGVAVAKLRANMCLGCRTTVSAQVERMSRQGQLVYCGNCGRIIVPA
jgi:predicted  nucleic acid-binding Zn-ribbon protein